MLAVLNKGYINFLPIDEIVKKRRLNGEEKCQRRNASKKIWNEHANQERKIVPSISSCKNIIIRVLSIR
jgi:hypothetical protein